MNSDSQEAIPYARLCALSELTEGKGKCVIVGAVEVAVFLHKGKVSAIHNVCPHHHSAILHDGCISNGYVHCPAHDWQFSLKDGKQPGNRRGVDYYPVEIREGSVYARVFEKKFSF